MAEYDALGSADYIIDGYVEATDELDRYERTGEGEAVQVAASALCHALTRASKENRFWDRLGGIYRRPANASRPGLPQLRDLSALIDVEKRVLEEAGLRPDLAARIASDVAKALRAYDFWPDESAATRVREAVAAAARAACIQASWARPRPPSRGLKKAVRIGGGLVVMVADAKYAPPGLDVLSEFAGSWIVTRPEEEPDVQ